MKNKSHKTLTSEAFGTTACVYQAQCVPPRSKRKRQRLRLRHRETPPPASDTSSSSTSVTHHHQHHNRLIKPRNHSGRHHAARLLEEYIPPASLAGNDRGSGLESHQPKQFLPFLKPSEPNPDVPSKAHDSETNHRPYVTHKSLVRLTKSKRLANESAPKPTPSASRNQLLHLRCPVDGGGPAVLNCEQAVANLPPKKSTSNITTNLQSFYKNQLKCPSDSMIPQHPLDKSDQERWTTAGSSRYLTDLKWRICYATNIYVYKNGDGDQTPILIHVPPAKKKSMQCILSLVEERISFPIGYAQCLYKMNGVLIRHPGELEMYNKYVVASNCDRAFKPVTYGKKRTPMLVLGVASKHVRELRGRFEAPMGLGKQGEEYQENETQNCTEVSNIHHSTSPVFQGRGDGDTGGFQNTRNYRLGHYNHKTFFDHGNSQDTCNNPGPFRRSFVPIKTTPEVQQEPSRYKSLHNQGQGDAFFATPPNTKASNKPRNGIKDTSGDKRVFYEDVATTNVLTGFDEPGGPYSEAGTQFRGPSGDTAEAVETVKTPLKPITPPLEDAKVKAMFTDRNTYSPQDSGRTIEISTSPRAVAKDSKTHLTDATTSYLQARPGLPSCATFRVMQPQYVNSQMAHSFVQNAAYHHHHHQHPAQQFFPEGTTILTNPASMQSVIYVPNPACQHQFPALLMPSNQGAHPAAFGYWPPPATPITRDWLPNSRHPYNSHSAAVGLQTSPPGTPNVFEHNHCMQFTQKSFISKVASSKEFLAPATTLDGLCVSQSEAKTGGTSGPQCKDQSMQTITSSNGPMDSSRSTKSDIYPLPPPSPFRDAAAGLKANNPEQSCN